MCLDCIVSENLVCLKNQFCIAWIGFSCHFFTSYSLPRRTRNGVRLWRAGQGRSARRVGVAGRGSPPASPGPCIRLLSIFLKTHCTQWEQLIVNLRARAGLIVYFCLIPWLILTCSIKLRRDLTGFSECRTNWLNDSLVLPAGVLRVSVLVFHGQKTSYICVDSTLSSLVYAAGRRPVDGVATPRPYCRCNALVTFLGKKLVLLCNFRTVLKHATLLSRLLLVQIEITCGSFIKLVFRACTLARL